MRATVAKRLRNEAEVQTIGQPKQVTRKFYRALKRNYKTIVQHVKPVLSKRASRIFAHSKVCH